MKLGTETGSLINHIMSRTGNITPEVGMGCTILGWTDRHPGTIVEVSKNGKRIGVQGDIAVRTDNNGMSENQTYEFQRNPDAGVHYYSLRKSGKWVKVGTSGTSDLVIGKRDKYYDYTF